MDKITKLTVDSVPHYWEERDSIFCHDVFDMQDITEIDSAGIAFLVQWAKARGNKLKILHMQESARALIHTFNLTSLFDE